MKKSLKQRDYCQFRFEKEDRIRAMILSAAAAIFLALIFYRSIVAIPFLSPLGFFLFRMLQEKKGEEIRLELAEQFKECILSVSASLQAGYAIENAFLESREDMQKLYGTQSYIYEELERIRRGLVVNIPLEEQLLDLGKRSGSEEVLQFAQMFSVAKRGGGNLPEMIRASANLIGQKIEARQEIKIMLSGRQMEQNIMRMMPFGILFYVGAVYPGYFDPLYHDFSGIAVMTLCLAIYLAAVFIGEKIFQGIWEKLEGRAKIPKMPGLPRKGILQKAAEAGDRIYRWWVGKRGVSAGMESIRRKLEMLCPEEKREDLLEQYYGGKIGFSMVVFLLGSLFAGCLYLKQLADPAGNSSALTIWGMSAAASVGIFFLMDKDLQDQVNQRKDLMSLGYPDLVHKLALYLVAGMTIRGAFRKIGESNELAQMTYREILSGQSEQTAYEHFGKRAGPREYVRLSTLLCQNLKKGSRNLLARLEEEAVGAAEKRVQNGKKLGEEAETKLLIPMVMLLAVVMIMIMIPAFSVMGG